MGAPSEAIRDRQGKWPCCPSTTAVLGIRRRRCRRVVCGSLRCWDPKESRISTTTHEKWPFLAPCRVLRRLVRQIGSNLLIGNPARPVPGFFVGPKTRQNNPICPLPLLLPLPVILVGCARWEVGKWRSAKVATRVFSKHGRYASWSWPLLLVMVFIRISLG